jgi:RNA polymerase sigma factor (sigma-70 family)
MGEQVVSEREELELFCAREHPRLLRSLTFFTGDPLVAEDLAQETLLVACRRWSDVRHMEAPGAWLHRVGVNAAKRMFRRRLMERRALARRRDGAGQAYEVPDTAEAVSLQRALLGMPERHRLVLVLRFYADFSVEQVAGVMDLTPDGVRSLTYRALERLRAKDGALLRIEEAIDVD